MNQPEEGRGIPQDTTWESLQVQLGEQINQTRKQIREISMLLDQSQVEVSKLAQRNTTTSSNLQRINSQLDNLPREEIRAAYDAALDAQQRLFVMRGQVEKLQSDLQHFRQELEWMERVSEISSRNPQVASGRAGGTVAQELIEMVIKAQEAERLRLSRQMHDGPAQALSNLILETDIAMRLFSIDQAQAYAELDTLRKSATGTFQQVRDFIFELRPMMLDDLGLIPTLKKYTSAVKNQAGIEIRLNISGSEQRLESFLEVMIFRAIQELLANALTHSQANLISIQLDITDEKVRMSVEDNGVGFNLGILETTSGMGLKMIKERVEMLRGLFEVSTEPGNGTQVSIQLPVSEFSGHE